MNHLSNHPRHLFFGALIVSLVLLLLGIASGQPAEVMAKAIRICLECVGIG